MQLGIGTGVFHLGEEGLVDPDASAEGFYMYAPFYCCVVVTGEKGFAEKIYPTLVGWGLNMMHWGLWRRCVCRVIAA